MGTKPARTHRWFGSATASVSEIYPNLATAVETGFESEVRSFDRCAGIGRTTVVAAHQSHSRGSRLFRSLRTALPLVRSVCELLQLLLASRGRCRQHRRLECGRRAKPVPVFDETNSADGPSPSQLRPTETHRSSACSLEEQRFRRRTESPVDGTRSRTPGYAEERAGITGWSSPLRSSAGTP